MGSKTHRVGTDRAAVVMRFNVIMNGTLHFILEVENRREGVDEHIEHGLFNHIVSILGGRSDNKMIRRNCIR